MPLEVAVKVTGSFKQTVAPATFAVGKGLIMTCAVAVAVQFVPEVTVTVYTWLPAIAVLTV